VARELRLGAMAPGWNVSFRNRPSGGAKRFHYAEWRDGVMKSWDCNSPPLLHAPIFG
jgi:hypothetical protein